MTLEEALLRIEALERRVCELEARGEVHHHHHYHQSLPPAYYPVPVPYTPPSYPYITWGAGVAPCGQLTFNG
jgi:hypothetical protein